ncbi:MAG: ATP-binding protein [Clostridiales Family XIII bacterium]|jgi:predicted AAA+ superfamily ATPase|nr:ATP-binding protein [Clostridiales Family XIII bacterium]
MIIRETYLDLLRNSKDRQIVKVITGIRRCGKSTVLELFQKELKEEGISDDRIISVNFEDPDFDHLKTYKALYNYISSKLQAGKMNYIFLDEIGLVDEWQKCVDGLFIKKNCDIYITGSNSYMLSSELATLISGRYIEIEMLPLSFSEYISYVGENDILKKYRTYLENSSFPYLVDIKDRKQIRAYLDGIYSTVLLNDVVARKKITNASVLKDVTKFMFDNIANITSANKITNTLNSHSRKISLPTVETYIEALCDCFMLYRVGRYDIKGKQHLKTGDKYYLADVGLRTYLLGRNSVDMSKALENVVYLELLRRGYEVYVGKIGDNEVDFIAIGDEGTEYYQVSVTTRDKSTLERELRPLDLITDHNGKYLLTLDEDPLTSYNGIKKINALEWLLK